MNEMLFAELLSSVEEMDKIVRGELEPGRVTSVAELQVRTIREKTGLSQSRFAQLIGVSKRTLKIGSRVVVVLPDQSGRYSKSYQRPRRPRSNRCTAKSDSVARASSP